VVPQDLVYQAERAAKEMEGFAGLLREHQDDVVGLAGKEDGRFLRAQTSQIDSGVRK
jgi:hypothetical protein